MSLLSVPLAKPVVMPVANSWLSISSQPRVRPFLRTSLLRNMICRCGFSSSWSSAAQKKGPTTDVPSMARNGRWKLRTIDSYCSAVKEM